MTVLEQPATSLAERIAVALRDRFPPEQRDAALAKWVEEMGHPDLLRQWAGFWRRPSQAPPPGQWTRWALVTGRGAGKLLWVETAIPVPFDRDGRGHCTCGATRLHPGGIWT